MTEAWQRDVRQLAERLIERGSVYDVEALEMIYDADQYLVLVEPSGAVRRMGREENLALFRSWAAEGKEPLSTEAEFLHVEEARDNAVVLIRRRMAAGELSRLFELRLRKSGDAWKVSGETVTPWPVAEDEASDGDASTAAVADRYFRLLRENASPQEVAALFAETVDFEIKGDLATVPWIGHREGRAGVAAFLTELRALTSSEAFDVADVLVKGDRAVAVGALKTRVQATGKVIDSEFAIVMTIRDGKITRYRLLEDSFAAAEAVRGDTQ